MNSMQTNRHIVAMEGGGELHTRKGWRGASRPRGTNKRRVLTAAGQRFAPLSRASRKAVQPSLWARFKAAAMDWIDGVRTVRLNALAAEAARQIEEAKRAAAADPDAGKIAKVTRA